MTNDHITPQNIDQTFKEPMKNNIESNAIHENGEGPVVVEVTSKILTTKEDPIQVEHVNIPSSKGRKGCCEIM